MMETEARLTKVLVVNVIMKVLLDTFTKTVLTANDKLTNGGIFYDED